MKTKILTLMAFVLFAFNSFAQNNVWTKDDRNNIYNDCLGYIGKYPNLTTEQKESISICYLNELTKQYTKQDYQNKIDIEIKKIRETTLTLCSKSLGIDLSEQKKEEPKIEQPVKVETTDNTKATKENLIGDWKDEESEFSLYNKGDFIRVETDGGKKSKGTWKIDGDVLTLYFEKTFLTQQKDYKILMFSKDKFVYQSVKNKKDTYTVTKVK